MSTKFHVGTVGELTTAEAVGKGRIARQETVHRILDVVPAVSKKCSIQ